MKTIIGYYNNHYRKACSCGQITITNKKAELKQCNSCKKIIPVEQLTE